MTSMHDDASIEFELGGTSDDYIDLSNNVSVREGQKKTKANGDDVEANDAKAPTNYFLHSLFSQVDISLNGTQVTTSTNTNAY
jgi:hypothetical protein